MQTNTVVKGQLSISILLILTIFTFAPDLFAQSSTSGSTSDESNAATPSSTGTGISGQDPAEKNEKKSEDTEEENIGTRMETL